VGTDGELNAKVIKEQQEPLVHKKKQLHIQDVQCLLVMSWFIKKMPVYHVGLKGNKVMPENNFNRNVFINCPFDDDYKSLLRALLFTIIHCGYNPRISLENADSSQSRLDKIQGLIQASKYSIHDISRCKAAKKNEFYRMNMPFEIGLDFGCKKYGNGELNSKEILILAAEQYQYKKALSDLSGIDIQVHNGNAEEMIRKVRDWFYTKNKNVEQPTTIWDDYNVFYADLYKCLGDKNANNMSILEFVDKVKEYVTSLRTQVNS